MPRKEPKPHDAQSLEKLAARMTKVADRLRAVGDALADVSVQVLQVADHKSMLKGLGFVEQFASNAESSLESARAGDYDASGRKAPTTAQKRAKKIG